MMEVVERYRLIEAAMRKDIDPMFADLPTDCEDKNRYIVLTALSYLAELIEVLRIKVTESRPGPGENAQVEEAQENDNV